MSSSPTSPQQDTMHSPNELLIDYVFGALDSDTSAHVEAWIASSVEAQQEYDLVVELLCDHALHTLEPVAPPPALRQKLLEEIQPIDRFAGLVDRLSTLLDMTSQAVHDALAWIDDLTHPGWEAGPTPNTKILHLPAGPQLSGSLAGFVRVESGTEFPHHKHLGDEIVLILQGAMRDADGTILRVGEERLMSAETEHSFEALDGPELIYMVTLVQGVEFPGLAFDVEPPVH